MSRYAPAPILPAVLVLPFLSGCVPVPPDVLSKMQSANAAQGATATFGDLDPGSTVTTSLHFTLRGYHDSELRDLSSLAESLYNKIGTDTGLYSYLASGSYLLVLYKDQTEYLQKTQQPAWSRGVNAGAGVYTYPGPDLNPVIAHEMTHVIFNAYMGDKGAPLRWLNEGLAMFEELAQMTDTDRQTFLTLAANQFRKERMPFSQMAFFTPKTEEARRVDAWYQQVESVVGFLLSQGSTLDFAGMMNALRNGADFDRALSDSYPGKFRSMADLETAWKAVS